MFWRRRKSSDFRAELDAHLENETARLCEQGLSETDARASARRAFGNVFHAEERFYEAARWMWWDHLKQDVRFSLRMLRKSPGFTLVAILTLALGTGVNSAFFGLVDSTLVQVLPFHEPERLVYVWTTDATGDWHTPSPAQYSALRNDHEGAFASVSGLGWVDDFYSSDDTNWQNLPGLTFSANWLSTLGIQPLLGRNFSPEEELPGHDSVALLSYGSWRSRFHADREILGKQIYVNRRLVTIIGVLPQALSSYHEDAELFTPLVLESYSNNGNPRAGLVRVQILARLKQGVTPDQARAEVEAIAQGLRGPIAPNDRSGQLRVERFAEELRNTGPTLQNARRGLWIMAAAAGLVLLVACANVASLMLARGVKRQRELALRAALGCSRGRMIRQLLTESALLFLCGGALGALAAQLSQELIAKAAAGIVFGHAYFEMNFRVLAFSLAVCLISALVFGMIPAWQASRISTNENLKEAPASVTGSGRSRRSRNLLVAGQLTLGMVLAVCFGLLFRSFLHVSSSRLGYDPRQVLSATMRFTGTRYADSSLRAGVLQAALERVREMPAVASAGIADSLPMNGAESASMRVEGTTPATGAQEKEIYFVSVSPGYFSTLQIPMLAGRDFDERDQLNANPVAIVNRTFAHAYFGDGSPIGRHLAFSDGPQRTIEIVGVVSDFRQRNPEEDLRPLAYFPVAQNPSATRWSLAIRVRSASDTRAIAGGLEKWLEPVDPKLFWDVGSLERDIHESESLTLRRPLVTLLGSFGSLAVLLALVGVFGVTSFSVAERTREIGLRIALGATRHEIAGLILRELLGVAAAGLAIGACCALELARFFPTQGIGWSGSGIFLYGVSRSDAVTYLTAAGLLIFVVLAAAAIPARRAMRVDPLVALRHE